MQLMQQRVQKSSRTTRPFGRDEDVGRLDVAVELARAVQRLNAGDELAQRGEQAVHVGWGVAPLLGDRRTRQE